MALLTEVVRGVLADGEYEGRLQASQEPATRSLVDFMFLRELCEVHDLPAVKVTPHGARAQLQQQHL